LTKSQWDEIVRLRAMLTDGQKDTVRGWAADSGLTVTNTGLWSRQADVVISKLQGMLSAAPEQSAAADSSVGRCDECGTVGPLMPAGDGTGNNVCVDDAACFDRVSTRVGASA
jgi:hypothetical protein